MSINSPTRSPPSSRSGADNDDERREGNGHVSSDERPRWKKLLGMGKNKRDSDSEDGPTRERWTMGILNDKETEEVPGTVLLLASNRNEPLGLRHQPERLSSSSLPSPYPRSRSSSRAPAPHVKKTPDGNIVLDPQPEDSLNDPLNWPIWRRNMALLSLGFYCVVGGGMTTILAAAFHDVSESFNVTTQQVALTTGIYMLGMGFGSVVMSPTAILYGKRPVYLLGATLFILSAIWCALSPNYPSLVVARVFQGIAVSPVECLPSATIAEIFFLHERAYRVGIYTLLLLGGKNLIPLVSAAITEGLDWRWVFWIVAMVIGLGLVLIFFFVPETFWDRTPRPRSHRRSTRRRSVSELVRGRRSAPQTPAGEKQPGPSASRTKSRKEVGFADDPQQEKPQVEKKEQAINTDPAGDSTLDGNANPPHLSNPGNDETNSGGYFDIPVSTTENPPTGANRRPSLLENIDLEAASSRDTSVGPLPPTLQHVYTNNLRSQPPVSFVQSLRPWTGRLIADNWFRVMLRPFILFAYPAVLWSALVYALSVGWLIIISEAAAEVYRDRQTYNFSALSTGLVYISPFIGGILGTVVAGKVSDIIVRWMTRRNGGIYEPEFRLVMVIPIALTTTIGLMGFGWSVEEKNAWIVPTVFFGVLSFGCTLGSTTSITFCVDSYRQYAGEALVTLNFCKNVLHGFIFSLFFVDWLKSDGAKTVFLALGGIQIACLLTSIPMYIYGKRMRMWTVRKRLMEKF
ncbi:hypothetical protein AJ80_08661 [Polytolypa hystricis UAMH7299]|uniref:Major facilitator superfamily (MFS) profile domain-containing protein n=1 Tax=Polytolypa hystricis (strain UAMH7299) TaxID=1447883 RepID=A0A2B7X453_POLH7|nr:hypothetical protein AJ80_08661 [Polytolypa hystricis UAMH7299]